MTIRFIWKKSCDTCCRYKKSLDALGVPYEGREMNAEPLTAEDLEALIGDRPQAVSKYKKRSLPRTKS